MGHRVYIQPVIRHKPNGSISDYESWDISGSWLHNELRVGKGRGERGYHTVVWCKREKEVVL